jgi:hypothetical protein
MSTKAAIISKLRADNKKKILEDKKAFNAATKEDKQFKKLRNKIYRQNTKTNKTKKLYDNIAEGSKSLSQNQKEYEKEVNKIKKNKKKK